MSSYDEVDGGGVLHRLMSKMSVRQKKDAPASDFTYVSHRPTPTPPPTHHRNHHVRQSSAPERNNNIAFVDVYKKPLSPEDDAPESPMYVRDIPPQAPERTHPAPPRKPFYTPPGTVEKNANNNHTQPESRVITVEKIAPPPRSRDLTRVSSISHRRTKSNPHSLAPLKIATHHNNHDAKYQTVPSPVQFEPLNTPITPGINEDPLAFRLRARNNNQELQNNQIDTKEKSKSLHNQPSRMEMPSQEQSLEFLMYGPNAVKYNEFKHSQELDRSQAATDWEGLEKIKRNLKQDHHEITQRLSQRFSRDLAETSAECTPTHPGGLSAEEHFYFRPAFTREDANQHLTGLPEGSFVVRQSRRSNSYALSLATVEMGVQHILVVEDKQKWQISSGTASHLELPVFKSVPALVAHYQRHKLPIKGCQRDVHLK